jgi:hypothetical protein
VKGKNTTEEEGEGEYISGHDGVNWNRYIVLLQQRIHLKSIIRRLLEINSHAIALLKKGGTKRTLKENKPCADPTDFFEIRDR